eukprot:TRINITY_DN16183_c0_g1_i1.p1 TRINITY_DN16183_c0_g1~~TRINITY_DN16183_c0_g1_i1.p1  ORF type:complete len:1314 (+),score=374.50 TRINITY_DN16183_c0_g1_i1:126-4067(+)
MARVLRRAAALPRYVAGRCASSAAGAQAQSVPASHQSFIRLQRVEDKYRTMTKREHVLKRSEMYIGSKRKEEAKIWDVETGRHISVMVVPGLVKLFDEMLVNASDNYYRTMNTNRKMTRLDVSIDTDTHMITIRNDGHCVDVEYHADAHMFCPELVFSEFQAGSNFNDEEARISGGRNGVGATVCNTLSELFEIEITDPHRGKFYTQTWRDSMAEKSEPHIEPTSATEEYTLVRFKPLYSFFDMTGLDNDHVLLFAKRVQEVAVCCNGIHVYLNGDLITINTFRDYVNAYYRQAQQGSDGVVFATLETSEKLTWQIAVGPGSAPSFSFVNAVNTSGGGSHVTFLRKIVVDAVCAHLRATMPTLKLHRRVVDDSIATFINALVLRPEFDAQTKDKLTYPSQKQFMKELAVPPDVLDRVCQNPAIMDPIVEVLRQKSISGTRKASKPNLKLQKLEDAYRAGTVHARYCTLVVTEGDSAKSLAIAGLSVVGRDYWGVFPVRGKLMNVSKSTTDRIDNSKVLSELATVLGLNPVMTYETEEEISTLRYGAVALMCDQDQDGAHIKGLLVNWLVTYWPALLQQGLLIEQDNVPKTSALWAKRQTGTVRTPFLKQIVTPLIKAFYTGTSRKEEWFFSTADMEAWRRKNRGVGVHLKYYKGLGSSTSSEGKEYFRALFHSARPMLIDFALLGPKDIESLQISFDDNAGDRRQWLYEPGMGQALDTSPGLVTVADFVQTELASYFHLSNERSIPSCIDGLKPSQRKVLYTCFTRDLSVGDMRVAQLGGAVSEMTNYHHGETSLFDTITKMAQDFVGSGNNVPLLVPVGQFGTRLAGGSDNASARYISTRLSPLARAMFPPEDDMLLDHVEEDGRLVEPKCYYPVIPLALANGVRGIGTGYTTLVPSFDPLALATLVWRMLDDPEFCNQSIARDTESQDNFDELTAATTAYNECLKRTMEENKDQALVKWHAKSRPPSKKKAQKSSKSAKAKSTSSSPSHETDKARQLFIKSYCKKIADKGPEKLQLDHLLEMRRSLKNRSTLNPWYHGHHAECCSEGIMTEGKSGTYVITELPVGEWTEVFKQFLDELVVKRELSDYKSSCSEREVSFVIKPAKDESLRKKGLAQIRGRMSKPLREHCVMLVTSPEGTPSFRHFTNATDTIASVYLPARLEVYRRRLDMQKNRLSEKVVSLKEKRGQAALIEKKLAPLLKEHGCITTALRKCGVASETVLPFLTTSPATRIKQLQRELAKVRQHQEDLDDTNPAQLWKDDLLQFVRVYVQYFAYSEGDVRRRLPLDAPISIRHVAMVTAEKYGRKDTAQGA